MIHYVNGSVLYNMPLSKSNTASYSYMPYTDCDKTTYDNDNKVAATFYTTSCDDSVTCSYFARKIKQR